jgi:hypothetical protein
MPVSIAPFDVRQVQARLQAASTPLRLVGLAADYAAVRNLRDFPVPCAYVVLAKETYEPNQPGQAPRGKQLPVRQVGRVSFGVVVAGRNYRSGAGGQLAGEIQEVLTAVRNVLAGWVPQVSGARPVQLLQGELLQYDDAVSLWSDVWTTQQIIGNEVKP